MTNRSRRLDSGLAARPRRSGSSRRHRLPRCEQTGLARYRDRHQARQAIDARRAGDLRVSLVTYACPDCRGYHVGSSSAGSLVSVSDSIERVPTFIDSLPTRARRYVLFDVENPTCGAQASRAELAKLWSILKGQAPGFSERDHIVIGAARSVAAKYRGVIDEPNVKWVVGANAPDAADRALLAAIDLHRVARKYDELVIISGDHAFAPLARRAKKFGLRVHVVTAEHLEQRSALARELSEAADLRTLVRLFPRSVRELVTAKVSAGGQLHRRVHSPAGPAWSRL
ncbi:NYN domain-containing protein [Agromyces sp. NPDC055658]